MAVMIDIPGIGEVEAKNAASEATLQAILKSLGGKTGGGGAGGGAANAAAAKSAQNLAKGNAAAASTSSKLGASLGKALGSVAKFGGAVVGVVTKMADMSNAITNAMAGYSNLDNNVTQAAGKIPLLGSTFANAAAATEKLVNATQNATNSGATFGGSVFEMSNAASRAGMTINEYSSFVRKSGDAFRLLGGDVETGRRRFDDLSKDLRKSGFMRELNNMGFTTVQVNESMARYTTLLGRTGKLQGMSTRQLTKASADYMKEIDLLAKATGKERSEIEDAQAQLLTDGQFQAKISGMTAEAADSFRNTISGMPTKGLQDIAKDIITTGSATTKESQLFASTMPKSAAMMMEFAKITEAGGTISLKQRNELNNLMSQEGKQMKGRFRDVARFDAEMAEHYMNLVESGNIQTDALLNATKAQNENAAATDGQMSAMEAMRRRINEISQTFTRLLASTGIMDTMMGAFETIAAFTEKILFPIFRMLSAVIMPVVDIISAVLNPVITVLGYGFEALANALDFVLSPLRLLADGVSYVTGIFQPLAEVVGIKLMGAFNSTKDLLEDTFAPPIEFVGRMVDDVGKIIDKHFIPTIEAVSDFFMGGFTNALNWVTDGLNWFGDTFEPVITPVAEAFGWLNDKIDSIGQAFTDFFNSFSQVGDVIDLFKLGISDMRIKFYELGLQLKSWGDSLTLGTSEEEAAEQAEMQKNIDLMKEQNTLQREELTVRFAKNRYENEIEALQKKKIRLDERGERDAELDKKLAIAKENLNRALKGELQQTKDTVVTDAKLNAQKQAELELNQSLSNATDTLKDFAKNEDSFLVSPDGTVIKDTRASVPVGQYSSARDDGVRGTIRAGDETNALDVISEQNYRQKKMDNPDYVPGKSEKEAADRATLNTEQTAALAAETLKVQYRILDAIEEMNSIRA